MEHFFQETFDIENLDIYRAEFSSYVLFDKCFVFEQGYMHNIFL
jgi:hypothetical protein